MDKSDHEIRYPEVAVCGLSCRLCPHYHTEGASRCTRCKGESPSCGRWASHRAAGREHDSFVTYAGLEDNIAFIERHGIEAFDADQRLREARLETAGEADIKARSKALRARLDAAASARSIRLALRP